jgi:hypothetical protein
MDSEIDGKKIIEEILETASKDKTEGKASNLYEAPAWLGRVTEKQVELAADEKCPFCEKGMESHTDMFSDGVTNGSGGHNECKKCGFEIGWISVDGYGNYTVSPEDWNPVHTDIGELAERISKEINPDGEGKKEGEDKEAEMIKYHFAKEREKKVARESIAQYLAKRFLWHEHERNDVKRMPKPGACKMDATKQKEKA